MYTKTLKITEGIRFNVFLGELIFEYVIDKKLSELAHNKQDGFI